MGSRIGIWCSSPDRTDRPEIFFTRLEPSESRLIFVLPPEALGYALDGLIVLGGGLSCGSSDIGTWGQFFLKYVVSHPAVTVVIPGTTRVESMLDNQGAGRGRLPDTAARREMERFWDTLA